MHLARIVVLILDAQVDAKRWDLSEAPPLPHPGDIEQPSSAVDPGYVQSLPSDLSVKTLRCVPSSALATVGLLH